jgi:hypothetical protein
LAENRKSLVVVEAVKKLESGVIPLLASPQGGVAASSIKCRAATEADAAGWFSFRSQSENHPGLAISGGFATFSLIARPPLLAVMQGGEYGAPKRSAQPQDAKRKRGSAQPQEMTAVSVQSR